MRSPSCRPSAISHRSPVSGPTVTGRNCAFDSASTTQTKLPCGPCITARCGTWMASIHEAPPISTRTNWPGRSVPSLLGSSARTRNVPVSLLNDASPNVMWPGAGTTVPSASTICTVYFARPAGAACRRCDQPVELQLLVLRDAEVDAHRVERRDVGEQAVRPGRDEAAGLLAREARHAGDGREDRRVAQVDFGLLHPRPRALDGGDGRVFAPLRVVEVLLAERILGRERPDALQVGACRAEPCLLRLHLGPRRRQRRLEGLAVHLEQHVTLVDDGCPRDTRSDSRKPSTRARISTSCELSVSPTNSPTKGTSVAVTVITPAGMA